MRTVFRITGQLLQTMRADLHRTHAFAAERVGFISCRPARLVDDGFLIVAANYHPVADEDYLDDPTVGAQMGPTAIRKALQIALTERASMFHVHMHEHRGMPRFSRVDHRESRKFVPDFFNVAPQVPHGALVLSYDSMTGLTWKTKAGEPETILVLSSVGAPLRRSWGTA